MRPHWAGLIGAGLVETTERGFRVTRRGAALKEHWRGGMFGWSDSLLPQLEKLPKTDHTYPITDAEVDDAYASYLRRL